MAGHQTIDDRSLAFGRAIAERLSAEPQRLTEASATLNRWLRTCSPGARPALFEWLAAVDESVDAVEAILTGRDERSVRLRQSNPFVGVLSAQERAAIMRRFRVNDARRA